MTYVLFVVFWGMANTGAVVATFTEKAQCELQMKIIKDKFSKVSDIMCVEVK